MWMASQLFLRILLSRVRSKAAERPISLLLEGKRIACLAASLASGALALQPLSRLTDPLRFEAPKRGARQTYA